MIRLERVWYRYPGGSWGLRGADLEVGAPGLTLITGPNGSGKTTLLKVAGMIYRPLKGSITVDGINPWTARPGDRLRARRGVVYVHEKPVMLRGTVYDNIAYGLRIRGYREEEVRRRVREISRSLGLEGMLGAEARRLSAGQMQLVSIARALAVRPRILLLDEPFSHLDRRKRVLLREGILAFVRGGGGVVIASHDTLSLGGMDYMVVYMEDGRVAAVEKQG